MWRIDHAREKAAAGMTAPRTWWRDAVFYHIYVRSFLDSDGDGIGDLRGVSERVDYLCDLGIDAVWLSPVYPSPQADFGYDVADYRDVDPIYGSLQDLASLRDALHARGMRLVLDFVPNHTSSAHSWFAASRASRTAPRRDWYIWRDPAPDGGPPNNWCSIFGGPAWTHDATTGQYYLHSFLPAQPDLNWRDDGVVAAMHEVLRYWLNWGADGFRVDAIAEVIQDEQLRANPMDPGYAVSPKDELYDPFVAQQHVYDTMQPGVFDVVRGMRRVLDAYPGRVLIGETAVDDWSTYSRFLGDDGFHLAFNFRMLRAHSLREVREAVEGIYAAIPAGVWPTLVLSNHDVDRHVTRLGASHGEHYTAVAHAAAAALLTARGTPFVYYGDEIGLPNTQLAPETLRDPVGRFERDAGRRIFFSGGYATPGRDPERTPMHWTNAGGGFTSGTPWLPFGDVTARNVADQQADPGSVWRCYRDLLRLRRASTALRHGDYEALTAPEGIWAFARNSRDERVVVVVNCTAQPRELGALLGEELAAMQRVHPAHACEPGILDGYGVSIFADPRGD